MCRMVGKIIYFPQFLMVDVILRDTYFISIGLSVIYVAER